MTNIFRVRLDYYYIITNKKDRPFLLKFIFSKKATKITKYSPPIGHLLSKLQINGEDFVIFCGLLIKHGLYHFWWSNALLF